MSENFSVTDHKYGPNVEFIKYRIEITFKNKEDIEAKDIVSPGDVGPFTKVFGNNILIFGTYETYLTKNAKEELVDTGVYLDLGRPLSPESDLSDDKKLSTRSKLFLLGKNGILSANFVSKSLHNEANWFDITEHFGVYQFWATTISCEVKINFKNNEKQWVFSGVVLERNLGITS